MTEKTEKIIKKKAPVRKKKPTIVGKVTVKEAVKPEVVLPPPQPRPLKPTKPAKPVLPKVPKYFGTGRRKEAVAKVWLTAGEGKITVNTRPLSQYFFGRKLLEFQVTRPLVETQLAGKYDVFARVLGGGIVGQAGAVGLGIARALVELDPALKTTLKRQGLLTRDPRMKERKKYGLKRARRAFQYTKR
jgi:small subunit ribosomal protein S9